MRIAHANTLSDQARFVASDIKRLLALDPDTSPSDIAVFSRTGMDHAPLSLTRTALADENLPVSLSWSSGGGFAISRTREFLKAVSWLKENKTRRLTADQLSQEFKASGLFAHQGPATRFLKETLLAWEDQTAGSRQLAGHAIDFLHAAAGEERREKRSGKGVYLSTAHGAKGLEFKHVFVLSGNWPHTGTDMDEERRLYYVAMTRAMATLTLMELSNATVPHIAPIRKAPHVTVPVPPAAPLPQLRYRLLGMDALFIDFAGRMIPQAPIHQTLADISPGMALTLATHKGVTGLWQDGHILCRLSNEGAAHWAPLAPSVHALTVVAMIRRSREDVIDADFARSLKCDTWEIPICEAIFQLN